MSEKKISKHQKVLEHLKECGSITSLEVIELYSATRLAAIIFTLRERGYDISTETIPFIDRYGTKSHYGKYVLNN